MDKYCITCGKVVDVLNGVAGDFHWMYDADDGDMCDIECEGPFASCPPPEMTEEMWNSVLGKSVNVIEAWENAPKSGMCRFLGLNGHKSTYVSIPDSDVLGRWTVGKLYAYSELLFFPEPDLVDGTVARIWVRGNDKLVWATDAWFFEPVS